MNIEEARFLMSVAYIPTHAAGNSAHEDVERGVISSWNEKTVFVKFDKDLTSLGWVNAQSKGCNPADLQPCAVSPTHIRLTTATCENLGIRIEEEPGILKPGQIDLNREDADKYFSIFITPTIEADGSQLCSLCNATLNGALGAFRWGMVTGEGFCRVCDYPARSYHSVKDRNGETIFTIIWFVLQYHPNEISFTKPASSGKDNGSNAENKA